MFRIIFSALVAAGIALPAAAEQQVCGKRADVIKQLSVKYSEAPTAMGLSSDGGVLEVLTSTDRNTWTIIVTRPDGLSCMVAVGEYWETTIKVATGAGV
jgi:hypothetical protein